MGKSYRIRANVGQDRQIDVNLEQDYEFIEILSLKIKQSDLYLRDCSNYGVIVGRVSANNGYGIPNAKVSVFIPVSDEDSQNEVINSIYPYKDIGSLNEDGYRYNLLPYEPSYPGHAATGTFPSRFDALTNSTVIEVYEKYYKFTVKTNSSGDYMIFGVPEGEHTVVMDVDLSDIGDFSLSPQDLIRMGRATEEQVNGPFFKSSSNLNDLPQLVTLNKETYVKPLWGQEEVCQIGIARVDFDLSGEAGIKIEPTAVFMGSILSTTQKNAIKFNCSVKKTAGELCTLTVGPGEILAIRHTINLDTQGRPILEQAELPSGGKLIDPDGTWMFELPMNLEYVTTNEFGEQVISDDPTIGIPTKGRYRFKIKWQQSKNINETVRRAYFLVPNIKEYGWSNINSDPAYITNPTNQNYIDFQKSYGFDLDWSGYTNVNAAINCEDTFYEFNYNKVYTVSSFIDNIKVKQAASRFLAIKEITDERCDSENNKFPTNDAVQNNSLIFVLMSFLTVVLQPIMISIFIITYILGLVWELLKLILNGLLVVIFALLWTICKIVNAIKSIFGGRKAKCVRVRAPLRGNPFKNIRLPMLSYPDCETCDKDLLNTQVAEPVPVTGTTTAQPTGVMSALNFPEFYSKIVDQPLQPYLSQENLQQIQEVVSGSQANDANQLGNFQTVRFSTNDLTLGEEINLYNVKDNYFTSSNGTNRIQVKIEPTLNPGKNHYDKPLIFLVEEDNLSNFPSGAMLSFVNNQFSKDPNWNSGSINAIGTQSITGITTQPTSITIDYASPSNRFSNLSTTYGLPQKEVTQYYQYPSDIEYYQVITAITVSQMMTLTGTSSGFNTSLFKTIRVFDNFNPPFPPFIDLKPFEYFDDYTSKNIIILQRGVDPYSPKFNTEVDLSHLFGHNTLGNVVVNTSLRINVPVQAETAGQLSLTDFSTLTSNASINNGQYAFNKSNFFKAGSQFTSYSTDATWFYSELDNTNLGYKIVTTDVNTALSGKISTFGSENLITHPSNIFLEYIGKGLNGGSYTFKSNLPILGKYYFSPVYDKTSVNINVNNDERLVLRSDRLPSSSYYSETNGIRNYYDFGNNKYLLQQQNNFQFIGVDIDGNTNIDGGSTGTSGTTIDSGYDFSGAGFDNVIQSFSCEGMVGLSCYSGDGINFGIKSNCDNYVQNGKYVFVRTLNILKLPDDIKHLAEWGARYRVTWGLCQGVFSEVFNNNWVNGTLFAYPMQINLTYNSQNKISSSRFCRKTIALHSKTNTYYYRSSPYSNNKFIGNKITSSRPKGANDRNILSPTTVIDLGPKAEFLKYITLSNKFEGYNISQIPQTSFGDTSDLINLFATSRLTNNTWIQNITTNGIGEMFSRSGKKVDGDYAQLSSINSQYNVVKFDGDSYSTSSPTPVPSIVLLGGLSKPVLGVYFSASTIDLQNMDYVSPGRVAYRQINGNTIYSNYGFKSQEVPFYKWNISPNQGYIFGNETNEWLTGTNDIFSTKYQDLDRTFQNSSFHFMSNSTNLDEYMRGYIWSVTGNSVYSTNVFPGMRSKILVGAPWHFYFGLKNGKTALDRFFKTYLNIEIDE